MNKFEWNEREADIAAVREQLAAAGLPADDWTDAEVLAMSACEGCGYSGTGAYRRRQNTAYADKESNYGVYCDACQEVVDEYWQETWDEYYAGLL